MDTVPADTWEGDAWEPVIRDSRLYGRGACDTKGSLAAMLVALKRLLNLGRRRQRIMFLATCDEEAGLGGAFAWAGLNLPAKAAVVGEPTRLQIVRAHKGAARWILRTRGQSVHSAHRDQGVSAITRMARVVLSLETFYEDVLRKRTHELLGSATLSVGTIRGGQTVNTVPDLCEVNVDRRTLPGETAAMAREEMLTALEADPNIDFEVECVGQTMDVGGLDTPEESPIVRRAIRACERVLGRSTVAGASYSTDAAVYAQNGIPCVVLGPGDIRVAHSDKESICLDELEKAVGVYLAMMRGE
jgi:acetylornithine deacetylase